MLSTNTVSHGAAASGYYKVEGYYKAGTDEAEASAQWFGKGASEIGLTGHVDDVTFAKLLEGAAPNGQLMGRYRGGEREHRPGEDLTFSAPKSVSYAALVLGDERLIQAHDKAVRTAMEFAEKNFVNTRRVVNGEIVTERATKVISGLFRHDTSRALDPQLHTHAVIANMVRQTGDNTYRAILNDDLRVNLKKIDAVYKNTLAREAEQLGWQTRRVGRERHVELTAIPRTVTEQFSKRSAEIEAALKDRNMAGSAKNHERAALATRALKTRDLDRKELLTTWLKEAREAGWSKEHQASYEKLRLSENTYLGGVTRETGAIDASRVSLGAAKQDAKAAITFALDHQTERASIVSEANILETALNRAKVANLQEIQAEIREQRRANTLISVRSGGIDYLATTKTLELEGAILKAERVARRVPTLKLNARRDRLGRKAISPENHLARSLRDTTLTPSQQNAISTSLTSRGRFVGVQGYAGTGKTFMLEKLRGYAERSGYAVEGIAPSNTATNELAKVLPGAETITRRLDRQAYRPDTDNKRSTLLVVDESSMLSTAQMRELMDYSNKQQFARVLLVGDQKQLNAVGAGSPFFALQRAGMPTTVMDDNQRQRNPDALQTVNHAIAGEVRQALSKINSLVESERITEMVANTYLALPQQQRDGTGVIILSNKARHETNAAIREGLKREDTIGQEDYKFHGLDDLRFTRAEKGDASSYSFGDVVMAFKNLRSKGLEAGVQYRVLGQDLSRNALELLDTRTSKILTLPLKQNDKTTGAINAFEPAEKAISAGDKIRFTMTDIGQGVTNDLQATVLEIDDAAIKVKDQDGQERTIPKSSHAAVGIDPAYAQTAHAFQGQTVDRILIGMGSREHLTDQKSFYVSVSRPRHSITLITDDREQLAERLGRMTGERPEALEALAEKNQDLLRARSQDKTRNSSEPQKTPDAIELEAQQTDLKEREERILAGIEKQLQKTRERGGPIR